MNQGKIDLRTIPPEPVYTLTQRQSQEVAQKEQGGSKSMKLVFEKVGG